MLIIDRRQYGNDNDLRYETYRRVQSVVCTRDRGKERERIARQTEYIHDTRTVVTGELIIFVFVVGEEKETDIERTVVLLKKTPCVRE